jgi:hypothetical protein
VGRPPQELMKGWGRAPICKAFRPDHILGIWATYNLAEEGKKGRRGGQMKTLAGKRRGRRAAVALWFEKELRNKRVVVIGSGWKGYIPS